MFLAIDSSHGHVSLAEEVLVGAIGLRLLHISAGAVDCPQSGIRVDGDAVRTESNKRS